METVEDAGTTETANRRMTKAVRRIWREALEWGRAIEEETIRVVEQFKTERPKFEDARRREEKRRRNAGEPGFRFQGFVIPRVVRPGTDDKSRRKTMRVYWQVNSPLWSAPGEATGRTFTSTHLRKGRGRGKRKYTEADFARYCIPQELELVMNTEQQLAELERQLEAQQKVLKAAMEIMG